MKIGVHGKEFNRQAVPFIRDIFTILKKNKVDLVISEKFSRLLTSAAFRPYTWKTFSHGDNLSGLTAFLSIGGDGTLLETVTYIGKAETPILGINTGRLGFLATISQSETEHALLKIFSNDFSIDKRAILKLESSRKIFGKLNFALNDFTIMKMGSSSMITVHTFIDGAFLNSYWSDGIIVATPTGSTGYSLSCGGPLVFPRSGNFVITPVSPHNLTVRPIVVADSSEITFKVESRIKKFLVTLDSRHAEIDETVKLKIVKADFRANLIQLKGQHFFKTLRQKLNWGLDIRN
ncbi:MAG: NAD kinase [Cyclobacteriaceae bacterium]